MSTVPEDPAQNFKSYSEGQIALLLREHVLDAMDAPQSAILLEAITRLEAVQEEHDRTLERVAMAGSHR